MNFPEGVKSTCVQTHVRRGRVNVFPRARAQMGAGMQGVRDQLLFLVAETVNTVLELRDEVVYLLRGWWDGYSSAPREEGCGWGKYFQIRWKERGWEYLDALALLRMTRGRSQVKGVREGWALTLVLCLAL